MEVEEKTNDIYNKIKSDIAKSGFPLEIRTCLSLEQQGWFYTQNERYMLDEKEKEVDIIAIKNHPIKTKNGMIVYLSMRPVIECKKDSNHPWVFFKIGRRLVDLAITRILCVSNVGEYKAHKIVLDGFDIDMSLNDFLLNRVEEIHFFNSRHITTAYTTACSGEGERHDKQDKQIHDAITNLIHAINWRRKESKSKAVHITIYCPVIIFDGQLFEATVSANEEIQLEKVSKTQIVHSVGNAGSRRVVIDVVTKEAFEEYLKIIENDALILQRQISNTQIVKRSMFK
jgi:hypothetical protein